MDSPLLCRVRRRPLFVSCWVEKHAGHYSTRRRVWSLRCRPRPCVSALFGGLLLHLASFGRTRRTRHKSVPNQNPVRKACTPGRGSAARFHNDRDRRSAVLPDPKPRARPCPGAFPRPGVPAGTKTGAAADSSERRWDRPPRRKPPTSPPPIRHGCRKDRCWDGAAAPSSRPCRSISQPGPVALVPWHVRSPSCHIRPRRLRRRVVSGWRGEAVPPTTIRSERGPLPAMPGPRLPRIDSSTFGFAGTCQTRHRDLEDLCTGLPTPGGFPDPRPLQLRCLVATGPAGSIPDRRIGE
mmetsp:Transcript_21283/g.59227  ORF Transcript_21283/g.59227 Transcript_21283/m.59227 type:complete len:295 (+) Transcript_21283:851-1735(+)